MKKTNPVFADARIGHHANRRRAAAADYPEALRRHFSLAATAEAAGEISAWPGYRPSALTPLRGLAAEFGLGAIHYKDESGRFGLGSFKALGGAYAVLGVLQQQIQVHTGERASARDLEGGRFSNLAARTTVVTATDSNHGRSVAWGAARFGCGCRIYIHAKVSERRARALGYGGFCAANIFAWRETDPAALKQAKAPIGAQNDTQILAQCDWADDILCGWGAHGDHMQRGLAVAERLQPWSGSLFALGVTKAGHPRHPLYIAYQTQPQKWTPDLKLLAE